MTIQCCIGIKGHLDPSWQEWFEDLQLLPQISGKTLLCGSLLDQAALYGVLLKINSLGLTLLSLEIAEPSLHKRGKTILLLATQAATHLLEELVKQLNSHFESLFQVSIR